MPATSDDEPKPKLTPFNVRDYLKSDVARVSFLQEFISKEEDCALLMGAIGDVLRSKRAMTRAAEAVGVSREGLYKSLSGDGNPSFSTVSKLFKVLGLELALRPIQSPTSAMKPTHSMNLALIVAFNEDGLERLRNTFPELSLDNSITIPYHNSHAHGWFERTEHEAPITWVKVECEYVPNPDLPLWTHFAEFIVGWEYSDGSYGVHTYKNRSFGEGDEDKNKFAQRIIPEAVHDLKLTTWPVEYSDGPESD